MKTEILGFNKPCPAKTFNSRLAAYSATATVALIAAPTAADAAVQNITGFTLDSGGTSVGTLPPNVSLGSANGRPNYHLEYFKAGPFDFGLLIQKNGVGGETAGIRGAHTNGFAGQPNSPSYKFLANKYAFNTRLISGASHAFDFNAFGNLAGEKNGGTQFGFFWPGAGDESAAYVGFKAKQNNTTYYGWLRVQVTDNNAGLPQSISLVASTNNPAIFGAYGLKGDGITAGEVAATPEPSVVALGGLALLACGAAGVREQRRRRMAAAKAN